jgi:hypothetical protein
MLVISLGHLAKQWVARVADYFLPSIIANGSQAAYEFIKPLSWIKRRLVSCPLGNLEKDVLVDHESFSHRPLMVPITAKPDIISTSAAKEALKNPAPMISDTYAISIMSSLRPTYARLRRRARASLS